MNAKQLWQAALERVRGQVSAASYATWFKATEGIELGANGLVVGVRSGFACEHLRQRFREQAVESVSSVLGRPLDVIFVVSQRQTHSPTDAVGLQALPAQRALPRQNPAQPVVTSGRPRAAAPGGRSGAREPSAPRAERPTRHERRATLDAPHTSFPHGTARAGVARAAQPPLLALAAEPAPFERPMPGRPTQLPARGVHQTHAGPQGRSVVAVDPSPRYIFETFVVGRANLLAYAAAQQVAKEPGQSYNPLFIYGGTGMGKTHLLLAIGHIARSQGLKVCYVPAERFANDIIEAIRHHTTEDFRAHYREVDVLLVDDIQFIAGKESTEEEFFHTFNTLHESNRQIVLSSDRTPKAMHHLQDRLRSRFEWGLLADIQPPDQDHRLAILRAKAASLGVTVPEVALAAIARPECTSVRELEGALTRVLAYAEMLRLPLDDSLVAQALAPLRSTSERLVGTEEVLTAVARHFAVTTDALRGKARDHAIAWPRQVAMYLLREETPASLSQIGQVLGGRDHTTIMHGCTHVNQEVASSERARQEINALRAELRGGSRGG